MVTILLFIVGFWLYRRPLPVLHAQLVNSKVNTGSALQLPWPAYGQSAFGAVGYGVLATNNTETPVPIASIAKTITALAILQKKPLQIIGQQTAPTLPLITLTDTDVQFYRDYLAKDGSVVPVTSGEQISEYQALQAILIPSANNIAETTARWAFGSIDEYVAYANQFVKTLGMSHTHVADASGFSPQTTSTAEDLVLLGQELSFQHSGIRSLEFT